MEQHRIQVQRRITEELLRRVPVGSTGSRDWFSADPYTRMHLATHAASGGQLDTLLDDPGFLSAADPDRLLPWLRPEMLSAVSPRARRAAGVYRRRAVLLRSANPQARAGILELAAAQDGDHELSTRFGDASTERPWRTVWAHGDQTPEHVEVGRQQGEALVVADGTPLAVTAAVDYYDQEWTLHCWDAAVGGALGEPLRVEHGPLRALAVLMLPNGTPRVIFSDGDGTLRSWDLAAGTEPSQPWVGSVGPIRALTVAPRPSGSPLAVSGGDDGRLQCWEPTTRTPVGDSVDAHAGPVTAVVPVAGSPTEPLVISAGEDGTIRCLDLATRRQRGRTVHVGRLTGLAATLLPDRTPLAVTVDENGSVTCWDLTLGTSRRGPLTRQGGRVVAVATLQLADQPLALTAEDDGTVRCWDPVTGTQIGPPLTGHLGGMRSLAAVVVGRTALAVTWDDEGYIRCWDIDTSAPITDVQGIGPITGVAAVALEEGAPLVVSGERYGTLRCWDLTSGFPIGDPLIGHHDQLAAVAVVKWPSHPPFLVSGGSWPWDGTLRRWDPRPDGLLGGDPLIATKGLKALATAVLPDGNPMAVTVEQGGDVLRCWDLNARAQRWHADLTDSVAAVATVTLSDGAVLVVTGSRDGTVQCWNLLTGRPHGEPATGHDEPVLTITTVSLSGRSPLAVTGARDGSVWCWDLATDPVQGQRLGQHSSPVLAIAALEQPQGSLLAATGSEYGTVRFWRLTGSGPTPEPVPVHASVYALATHGTLLIVGSGAGVLALDFSTTG